MNNNSIRFKRIFNFMLHMRRLVVSLWFLAIAGIALSVITPYVVKLIIDKAYAGKDIRLFFLFMGILAAVFLLNGLCQGIFTYIQRIIRLRIAFYLHKDIFHTMGRLPYSFYQKKNGGERLVIFSHDIEQVVLAVMSVMTGLFIHLPKLMLLAGLVFWFDWKLACIAFLAGPLTYYASRTCFGFLREAQRNMLKEQQVVSKVTYEFFSHILLIKVFGRELGQIRRYVSSVAGLIRASQRLNQSEIVASFVSNAASKAAMGIIMLYGGWRIVQNELSLGLFAALVMYLSQLMGEYRECANVLRHVSVSAVSWERIEAIEKSEKSTMETFDARPVILSDGEIVLKDVTFGYSDEKKIFENLNVTIPPGAFVALTGSSGKGKTTFLNLTARLFPIETGSIFLDGKNISDIKAASLYEQLGVVTQEPYLWDDTVENNIRFSKPYATFEEVRRAAAMACADTFIEELPERWQTVVGENACRISEGQKQRIAIARALLLQPRILFLDEALSSVDQEIEARILNNIRAMGGKRTVVIISHRLSTIQNTDEVYFIADSQQWYHGSHNELLHNVEAYRTYMHSFT